jgi:alkylhydroperoxidase family enzyme
MSRLAEPDLTDPTTKVVYDKLKGNRDEVRGMYRALLNHPALASHVEQLGTYFRFEGTLRGDLRELGIMATARGMGTPFIWIQHIKPSRDEGLPDAVIAQVLDGDPATADADLLYRQVWQVARHVVAQETIPEALQQALIDQIGTEQTIELVAVCGFYRFIASIAVGFDVPPPPPYDTGDLPMPFSDPTGAT